MEDKQIIEIYQELRRREKADEKNAEVWKNMQTKYWSKIVTRHTQLIYSAMHKVGNVKNIDFKDHPLYPELVIALRYAISNYKADNGIAVSTFLYSSCKIYISRFYSYAGNHVLINNDEAEAQFNNCGKEDTEIEEPAPWQIHLQVEAFEESHCENSICFIAKMLAGLDAKRNLKFSEIIKVFPEASKLKKVFL